MRYMIGFYVGMSAAGAMLGSAGLAVGCAIVAAAAWLANKRLESNAEQNGVPEVPIQFSESDFEI